MEIQIDKKTYWSEGAVASRTFPQFSNQLRTTGKQLREDRQPFPIFAPFSLVNGLGRRYFDPAEGSYHMGSCETIWGAVTLPLLCQPAYMGIGITDSAVIVAYFDFADNTYALVHDGARALCAIWDWGTHTWKLDSTILASTVSACYDAVSIIGERVTVVIDKAGAVRTYNGVLTGGVLVWTLNTDTNLTGNGASRIIRAAGTLYITTSAPLGASDYTIKLFSTTNNCATWTSICTFTSTAPVQGLAMFTHTDNAEYPFVGLAECVWVGKAAPVIAVDLAAVSGLGNCTDMKVWNGVLMIGTGDDMIALDAVGNITPMGLATKDGLPGDYRGITSAILAARFHLLAAVYAPLPGIYRFDGNGWHPLWVAQVTGGAITRMHSTSTPGTPTLFFSLGVLKPKLIENIHANPREISGCRFEPSGFIDYSILQDELSECKGTFYKTRIYAHDLVDDAQEVDVFYDVNESGEFKFLGTLNKSITHLDFDNVEAYTLQLRLVLKRGVVDTFTPKVSYPALDYQRLPDAIASVQFSVDVKETERRYNRPDVVSEVREHQRMGTVMTVSYIGLENAVMVCKSVDIHETPKTCKAIYTLYRLE